MTTRFPAVSSGPEAALHGLGQLRLAQHSMESLLQEVADLAHASLAGRPEASVTLLREGVASTAVSSGELAHDLDESQHGYGHGPCLQAAGEQAEVLVADVTTDGRWPDYLALAEQRGCRSSLSLPLPIHEGLVGALNLYATEPHAFDEPTQALCRRFAAYVAVVAGNLHAYSAALSRAENLERALQSRAVIDQAKGILMERHKLTADQAFQLLARTSNHANTKLRDIAEHVVTTGELPGAR